MEIKLTKICFCLGNGLLKLIMRTFLILFCTTVFGLSPKDLSSQNTKIIIDQDKTVTVDEVFKIIKSQTNDYMFIYPDGLFKDFPKVKLKKGVIRMNNLINKSLKGGSLGVILTDNNTILIKESKYVQQQTVTGRVVDEYDQPIVGASVFLKGSTKGTTTDFDGKYTITVNSYNILTYSFLGYKTQEITVGNRSVINVKLLEDVTALGEVVLNAGYYKTSKDNATGNISKVSSKAIDVQPVSSPLGALQGRLPGVIISQTTGVPGGRFNIEIRGLNSINGGNSPLIIMDGTPLNSEIESLEINTSTILRSGVDPLNGINPNDIESIEILKDADATAIYGSRGANGVVLITTKKGKAGKTQFEVDVFSGFSTVSNKLDFLNTQQFLDLRRQAFANDAAALDPRPIAPGPNDFDLNGTYDLDKFTDWQDFFIGNTAHINNLQLSVSGGNEQTQFRLSGNFNEETTVFPGDFRYKRLSLQSNVTHKSSDDKFKLSLASSYSISDNFLPSSDLISFVNLVPNRNDLRNENGDLNFDPGSFSNPLGELNNTYRYETSYLASNLNLDYNILPKLTLRANFGYNKSSTIGTALRPTTLSQNPDSFNFGPQNSTNTLNNTFTESWSFEPQINWTSKLGIGKLDVLVGMSFQDRKTNRYGAIATGFSDDALINNVGASSNTEILRSSGISEFKYNAFFGRLNYNIKNKYIFNLTGRRDGSSRFGAGNRFSNFGAAGVAWLFSKESFLASSKVISFGKFRASYGVTGNDQIPDYGYLDAFSSAGFYDGIVPIEQARLANPFYSWEGVKKLEFGLDLGFLEDRIRLNTTYYRNRTDDQLIGIPLSGPTGFTSFQGNLPAVVENRGLELELTTRNFTKDNFSWITSFNITIPRNELISFENLENNPTFRNQLVIGQPIDVDRVFEFTGVDPDTGFYTFTDFDDSGDVTFGAEDAQVNKTTRPDFFGGLTNSITFGNFNFDFTFRFVKREAPGNTPSSILGQRNITTDNLNGIWEQSGDDANIQVLSASTVNSFRNFQLGNSSRLFARSDASYVDASFIRLNNVSLSYTIPQKVTKGFKANIYLRGQNLLTITNYNGFDPENFNRFVLPPLKTITLGTKFTF